MKLGGTMLRCRRSRLQKFAGFWFLVVGWLVFFALGPALAFEVLGQQQIKHGTLIKTQIITSNGEPVAINYVVHDNDIAWQIRDIYLSGSISELATHRSEFAGILRTSGIDGLITSLNKKADDLQS